MWFKNFNLYNITSDIPSDEDLVKLVEAAKFPESGIKKEQMYGFSAPAAFSTDLVHSVMGLSLMCIKVETRKVPGDLLREEVEEHLRNIAAKGITIDKSLKQEAKEICHDRLFKKVLPKIKKIMFMIDRKNKRLVINESSANKADIVTSFLLSNLDMKMHPVMTNELPCSKMKLWTISNDYHAKIQPGSKCKLFNRENTRNKVNFTDHHIKEDSAVEDYLNSGYEFVEQELYVYSGAEPIAFVLTEDFIIKGVTYPEYALSEADAGDDPHSDLYSILVVVNGIINDILKILFEAFGGEEVRV